ncbi:MAG: hypothetical protein ACFFGZ_09855, partial [Candidatus Thorarchaeota archaeon]
MKQIILVVFIAFLAVISFHRAQAQEWQEFMLEEEDLSAEWHIHAKTIRKNSEGWSIWEITWYKGINNRAFFSLQVHNFSAVSQATDQYDLLEMSHRGEAWKNITSTSFEESGFARWFARTAYEAHRLCVDQVVEFYFLGQYRTFLISGEHVDVAAYRWNDIRTVVEAQLAKITSKLITDNIDDSTPLPTTENHDNNTPGFILPSMFLSLALIAILSKKRKT